MLCARCLLHDAARFFALTPGPITLAACHELRTHALPCTVIAQTEHDSRLARRVRYGLGCKRGSRRNDRTLQCLLHNLAQRMYTIQPSVAGLESPE